MTLYMTLYEKLSLIITAAGCLVTFLAVVVALWQTHVPYIKKIKMKAVVGPVLTIIGFNNKASTVNGVQLELVNIGHQDIQIVHWGLYINKSNQIECVDMNGTDKTVEVGKIKRLNADAEKLKEALEKSNMLSMAKAQRHLRVFIQMNDGKTKKVRIMNTARFWE